MYIPAIRRTRQLLDVEAYDHFVGTEFTDADLAFIRLHEHYRLLGKEDHAGVPAYKVEEKMPQERLYYSRIVIWVAKDSFLPLRRDYYDIAGRLWKTELIKDISVIDNVPIPLRIVMKDVQEGSSTELEVSMVIYNAEIPDEVFDPKLLPKVVNLPLWQTYGSRPTGGK